ncbi:uncharacterized protein DS421_12g380900 [Arachis hypogaea]|nr:uncharacterized protein DS421_12g380900 [Arachis hypogaea]
MLAMTAPTSSWHKKMEEAEILGKLKIYKKSHSIISRSRKRAHTFIAPSLTQNWNLFLLLKLNSDFLLWLSCVIFCFEKGNYVRVKRQERKGKSDAK